MTKSRHQKRIESFMLHAGQEVKPSPGIPSEEVRILRAKLILEEALETIKALGIGVDITIPGCPIEVLDEGFLNFYIDGFANLVEIADGCADISVVTIGTLSSCGIHDVELFDEVDKSNLAKFERGSYKREDGKWMKPPGWQSPKIQQILDNQE